MKHRRSGECDTTLARLCYENPGLSPRAAVEELFAGRRQNPGYGRVVGLLPGTPT
jgi:thermitase